jgi:ribosomal protein S19E (S16A)
MITLTPMQLAAARYVRNTNGGATHAHFIEDHEPVGDRLWDDLERLGCVREDAHGHIFLTESGEAALKVTP